RNRDAADGHVRVPLTVSADHAAVIHLVNVVASQDQDVFGVLPLDRVDVLVNGVGGALVPRLVDALLGGQHLDRLAEFGAEEAPAGANVPIQAARLELRDDEYLPQIAVDAVREGEVDDAVQTAERHGRLCPVAGEWFQASALATRQDHGQNTPHDDPRLML